MANLLQKHFPMIRDQKMIIEEIQNSVALKEIFQSWEQDQQEEFLNFCTGVKGVKILYDVFVKEVLNPNIDSTPLSDLLSVILMRKVQIIEVLPNDDSRITASASLIVTDILVVFEDRSYGNVEIQKIGYMFPGERAACYSADLLLRQYKRVRDKKRKKFSYKDMKPVYTIVFFEKSPKEFHVNKDKYIHNIYPTSDTGIELQLLQNYSFIALDIYKENRQNKGINTKLDAWMVFLSSDEPEDVVELITKYPEFKSMYEIIYELCLNTEKVMNMFSKELRMMDDNTVAYMIDVMQEEIDAQKKALMEKDEKLDTQKKALDEKDAELSTQKDEILSLRKELELLKNKLQE